MQAVKDGTECPLYVKSDPADSESELIEAGKLDAERIVNCWAWSNGEYGLTSEVKNRLDTWEE